MTEFTIEQFKAHIQDVIEWNRVGRAGFDVVFTQDDINRQTEYTVEELLEAIGGFANNDHVAALDGIADTFVTYTYLIYMMDKQSIDQLNNSRSYELEGSGLVITQTASRVDIVISLNDLLAELYYGAISGNRVKYLYRIYDLLKDVGDRYEVDINQLLTEVSDSNWSKYPVYEEGKDYAEECKWIGENRKKTNVAALFVYKGDGSMHVVFRDDNGEGKICKPSSFVEPEISKLL